MFLKYSDKTVARFKFSVNNFTELDIQGFLKNRKTSSTSNIFAKSKTKIILTPVQKETVPEMGSGIAYRTEV
jgi:hypothetical protein